MTDAKAAEIVAKAFDSPYVQALVQQRAEALTNSYLKRLAFFAAIPLIVLSWFGYTKLEDIQKRVNDADAAIDRKISGIDSKVDDQRKNTEGKLKEIDNDVAKKGESLGLLVEDGIKAAKGQLANLGDVTGKIATFENNLKQTDSQLNTARDLNTKAFDALSSGQRSTLEATVAIAKTLPEATKIESMSAAMSEGLKLLAAETQKLNNEIKAAEKLRTDLKNATDLYNAIDRARIMQIVALQSKGRTVREVTLPRLGTGTGTLRLRLEAPGDIDKAFDLKISIDGAELAVMKGLSTDAERTLGQTGYKVVVEFIYHGAFVNDFVLLRIVPT